MGIVFIEGEEVGYTIYIYMYKHKYTKHILL